jgi:hypothetical protein
LHKRIDPAIKIVCNPPKKQKLKIRIPQNISKNRKIPKNAPIWTLNREALETLKWENKEIPIYDPDTDQDSNDGNDSDDDNNNNEAGTSNSRKRKRKGKGKEKEKRKRKGKGKEKEKRKTKKSKK